MSKIPNLLVLSDQLSFCYTHSGTGETFNMIQEGRYELSLIWMLIRPPKNCTAFYNTLTHNSTKMESYCDGNYLIFCCNHLCEFTDAAYAVMRLDNQLSFTRIAPTLIKSEMRMSRQKAKWMFQLQYSCEFVRGIICIHSPKTAIISYCILALS